jgi:hypothetical protein
LSMATLSAVMPATAQTTNAPSGATATTSSAQDTRYPAQNRDFNWGYLGILGLLGLLRPSSRGRANTYVGNNAGFTSAAIYSGDGGSSCGADGGGGSCD